MTDDQFPDMPADSLAKSEDPEAAVIRQSLLPDAVRSGENLVMFLRKRLADEATALREALAKGAPHASVRGLEDIQAKLYVLDEVESAALARDRSPAYMKGLMYAVRQLGAVYSDHPDYKANWRP
ncbi:DUF6221 family protein [Streptomyces halobius]|uniref:DUF6221 family protein n=1 Tax=Streptomyces halobius TaxID=2879846 RepID=A0ABY4MLA7_9ACTN|nr:DUF6221 family protein [Streptomyces halobius]UQA97111.1 DUF6221 family protein [Streptomyces halobius]